MVKLVYIEIHRKDDDCLREPMQFNFPSCTKPMFCRILASVRTL